jgi:hypothetical protein
MPESNAAFAGKIPPLVIEPIVDPDKKESVDSFTFQFCRDRMSDKPDELRIVCGNVRDCGRNEMLSFDHCLILSRSGGLSLVRDSGALTRSGATVC